MIVQRCKLRTGLFQAGNSGFQVPGMIEGFGGLKFLILGFFGTENFGKYSFGDLDLSRDFYGYSKLMFLFFVLYRLMLSGNFYGWEIWQPTVNVHLKSSAVDLH